MKLMRLVSLKYEKLYSSLILFIPLDTQIFLFFSTELNIASIISMVSHPAETALSEHLSTCSKTAKPKPVHLSDLPTLTGTAQAHPS